MANAMRNLEWDPNSLLSKAFMAFKNQTEQTKTNVDNVVQLNEQNLNSKTQLHRKTQNTIQATWQATAKVLNFSAR